MTARNEGLQVDTLPMQMYIKKPNGSIVAVQGDSNGNIVTSGLVPEAYDYIELSPTTLPTTVTYKTGGSGGTTVATLTIVYNGNDIQSVERA